MKPFTLVCDFVGKRLTTDEVAVRVFSPEIPVSYNATYNAHVASVQKFGKYLSQIRLLLGRRGRRFLAGLRGRVHFRRQRGQPRDAPLTQARNAVLF